MQCLDKTSGDTSCDDNWLPLVAQRPIWVRVYVRSGEVVDVPNVKVHLKVSGAVALDLYATAPALAAPDRDSPADGHLFFIDCEECGDVMDEALIFQATVDPDDTIDERDETNNDAFQGGLGRMVRARRSFDILVLPMDYRPPGGVSCKAPTSVAQGLADWLVSAFPVPQAADPVSVLIGPTYFWSQAFNPTKIINALNALLVTSGAYSPPDQIVVLVPACVGWGNGISNPMWYGGQGVVVLLDAGAYTPGRNGSLGFVVAHEIGHNLGRQHPCTSTSDGYIIDPDWPYQGSGVAGLDYTIQETGLEGWWLGSYLLYRIRPHTQIEFMQGGHCGQTIAADENSRRWLSPYTYYNLFCALSLSEAAREKCWAGHSIAIGTLIASAPEDITAAQDEGEVESVLVSGVINPDTTGDISTVYRLAEGTPNPPGEGEYCVELEDGGTVVGSQCFDPRFDMSEVPGPPEPSPFSLVLAWVEGIDRIVLRHGTDVLDSVAVSANAPTVQVTAPSGGALLGGTQTVQWQAQDGDGDSLSFALLYSWDGGASFFPIAADISETSYQANLDDLAGGNDAFFRVIATDNTGNSASGDSEHFRVATKPPVATILAPEDGSEHQIGNPVVLTGSAADKEDRTLPPEAYVWSSDRDGQIGTGPLNPVADLSPGWHTITLAVTDSDGQKGSASVRIFVGIPTLVDVRPDALNVGSPQPVSTVTAYVELPFGYDINQVDTGSVKLLVGTATLSPTQTKVGDFDNDELADLELTFNGQSFVAALPASTDLVTAAVSGELEDGTDFRGADVVEVVNALSLVAGWNQACYAGPQQAIDAAMNPIISQVVAVYRMRKDGGYDRWFPGRPEVSTITTVNPFEPLLILMSGGASWVQDVSAMSPASADLVMGWNSVCYGGRTEPVAEAAAGMSADLSLLYTLGSDQVWRRYVPGDPELTSIDDLAHLAPVLGLVTKEEGTTWSFDLIHGYAGFIASP
jgi:hypothetical protein